MLVGEVADNSLDVTFGNGERNEGHNIVKNIDVQLW